ncbi:MAG: OmpL47-type beta-barrel domain-containing protein [Coriobacteriia bacterium]
MCKVRWIPSFLGRLVTFALVVVLAIGQPLQAYSLSEGVRSAGVRAAAEVPEPTVVRCEETDPRITYEGSWLPVTDPGSSGGSSTSTVAGSSVATFTFTGTSVTWIADTGPDYGIASVSLDSGVPVEVDLYAPTAGSQQSVWTAPDLAGDVRHTVRVAWTGTKNPAATSTAISIDAFDIAETFPLDVTAPVTACNIGALAVWQSASAVATFTATDALSGVAGTCYRIGESEPATYTAPLTISAEGTTDIEYWSVDASGNAEVSQSATVKIDRTAPVTASDAQESYDGSATISLSANDALSGVDETFYSFDGGATAFTGTKVTTDTPGAYALTYWSQDAAGNIEKAQTTEFSVTDPQAAAKQEGRGLLDADTTPPVTSIQSQALGGWARTFPVTFTLSATDDDSGVARTYYNIYGSTWVLYTGYPVYLYCDGETEVRYRSVDVAGNWETPKTALFRIDTSPPSTQSDAQERYHGEATITLSPEDWTSGVESTHWVLDGAEEGEGTIISTSTVGAHVLEYASTDVAGNVETTNTVIFRLLPALAQIHISEDTTWGAGVHAVEGDLTVDPGATLTIDPGAIVKFVEDATMAVDGSLVAAGTEEDPIVFTSIHDDSFGGDTDGDGEESPPENGMWTGLVLNPDSQAALNHASILWAGSDWAGYYAALTIDGSSPMLEHITISDSASDGIDFNNGSCATISDSEIENNWWSGGWVDNSSLTVSNTTFSGNSEGIYITGDPAETVSITGSTIRDNDNNGITIAGASSSITGNTVSGNGGNGISVETAPPLIENNTFTGNGGAAIQLGYDSGGTTTPGNTASGNGLDTINIVGGPAEGGTSYSLSPQTLIYTVSDALEFPSGTSLNIAPGTVIKFGGGSSLGIWGELSAVGDKENPITLTSLGDDTIGGDTDKDSGEYPPSRGAWNGIEFFEGSSGDLVYVTMRWGGRAMYDRPARFDSSLIELFSVYAGGHQAALWIDSEVTLDHIDISGSSGYGIYINGGESAITDSSIHDNDRDGIDIEEDALPSIQHNRVYANGWSGISNYSDLTLPITYNDVYGNLDGQIYSYSSSPIDVRYNYWGRFRGPTAGERSNVFYEPWATTPWATTKGKMVLGGNTDCGIYGEPINTSTGNFYFEASDISLPGVGPALEFSRTYNSQDTTACGILGHGWATNYSMSLQVAENGDVIVCYPDGRRVTFTAGESGYAAPVGTLEKLAAMQDGYILTATDQSTYTFSSGCYLIGQADRYGNTLSFTYTNDQLTSVTAPGGRSLSFAYSGDLLTEVSDSAGRSVAYSYDDNSNLTDVTDLNGEETTYSYDDNHLITSVAAPEHPETPFVKNVYDSLNRVVTQYDGLDSTSTLSYDPEAGVTTITDNRGNTLIHVFDSLFRLTSSMDGAGVTAGTAYNAAGLAESTTDGRGNTTTYTYDANGNQTDVTDAAGHHISATYDLANNNLLSSTDALGRTTTYSWDASGTNLESVTTPVSQATYDYFANGLLHHSTLGGATTTYGYTSSGLLSSLTNPLGYTSHFGYDSAGRMTSATDAEGRATTTAYDAEGNITSVTDALENSVSFEYDANGNRTSATDAEEDTTHFSYNTMDLLTRVTDALTHETHYTYDKNYNLSSVTNARGKTTHYSYTANDLLESVTDPFSRTWTFEHDAAGNQTKATYPDSTSVESTYTVDNLLHALTAGPLSYTYAWSPTHMLTGVTDNESRTWSYSYDLGDRLTASSDTANPSIPGFTVTRSYDAAGNLAGLKASAEGTRTYIYDLADRLASLTLPSDVTTHTAYTWDRSGLLTEESLPDGSLTGYAYDGAGRLSSIVATLPSGVLSFAYTRDANGRVTGENGTAYAYDALGRLSSWYDPVADDTTVYTYDAAGNLTDVSVDGSSTAHFTYDDADRISSDGYAYDANGNMTSDGRFIYAYDALNRLSTVRDASAETTVAAYEYDYLNRRISSTDSSGTTVYYHYDGASGNAIAETDENGTVIATYAYANGVLHSMTRGGQTYYYHLNAHGDVIALTNASGGVVVSYSYDPWGNPLSTTGGVENPYRYAGYRYDTATSLYYCWNRYYSPSTFRFITKDIYPGKTTNPASMNGYLYCLDDPVNGTDPSGMFAELAAPLALGAGPVGWVLLGIAAVGAIAYAGYQIYQKANTKHNAGQATANLNNARNHLEKLQASGGPNVDPDWNKHKKECQGAIDKARNYIKRLKGNTQADYTQQADEIARQLAELP